ncbi:Reverse transcriptase [Theobroma cacao]|nr:Reverse transcriptase [Theobroma cacao]
MQGEFEMSMMGELKYFLGLQIKQSEKGIFINQERYTHDMLKKFDMLKLKSISTPMSPSTKLDLDEKGKDIDQKLYREQGTEVVGSETKKQQTSPPNSEEVSIIDIFHQMVKEEQAEKDTAMTETPKDGEYVGKGKKPASATRVKAKVGKAKATTAPPTEAKPPTKEKKTMATKIAFLKRKKSSKLVEKFRPVSTSSPQSPILVLDKSSLEPSPRQSSPLREPSPFPLNPFYDTESSPFGTSAE